MTHLIDQITLDRLVDDELDEAERRDLLRRLDASPDGWRRLALAFLEAREFARSATVWARDLVPVHAPSIPSTRPRPRRARWALAASLVGAVFASGFAAGRAGAWPDRARDSRPSEVAEARRESEALADIARAIKAMQSQPAAVPDYVRSQWERRGYRIDQERKLMAMHLGDGRRVLVPVDDVRVEYVGRPTF